MTQWYLQDSFPPQPSCCTSTQASVGVAMAKNPTFRKSQPRWGEPTVQEPKDCLVFPSKEECSILSPSPLMCLSTVVTVWNERHWEQYILFRGDDKVWGVSIVLCRIYLQQTYTILPTTERLNVGQGIIHWVAVMASWSPSEKKQTTDGVPWRRLQYVRYWCWWLVVHPHRTILYWSTVHAAVQLREYNPTNQFWSYNNGTTHSYIRMEEKWDIWPL